MPRRQRDWKTLGTWVDVDERERWEADRWRDMVRVWNRMAEGQGLAALRDGFAGRGWTDEDMVWVIDHGYLDGRCEHGALAAAGYLAGLPGRGVAAFRAAAEADAGARAPVPDHKRMSYALVPPPPTPEARAAWIARRARGMRGDRRRCDPPKKTRVKVPKRRGRAADGTPPS